MNTVDSINIWLSAGNLLFSSAISIGVIWVGAKASKINTLENDLKAATNDLIDARMATIQSDLRAGTREVSLVLQQVQNRLDDGSDQFKQLGEQQHKTELHDRVANAEMRQWATSQFATRQEFCELTKQLQKLAVAVAGCDRCRRNLKPEDNSNAL